MRKLGYFENFDRHTGKTSYIKRISRESFYPRFHVYIAESDAGRVIDLHLDQKRPSYAGSHAHNAEYDSEPVKREAERMRGILAGMETAKVVHTETGIKEKKGWWGRIWENFKF
ncbi:hypothetical protein A2Y83_00270 [Candidatus Falkowbacteria bacterium RBG_13_39_14]|uniref:Uncharacterized protein n=1 Tax=Candidatus Falkowbacteria bacterium RBG_13_39_14 TaxID=1797985 RepID=A0A1F5S477_9BACT|nr:MAG: hypothetical protein A2Y83_00270 [Candidatus Falkowbacteria bacterium RBG_13_39_14]